MRMVALLLVVITFGCTPKAQEVAVFCRGKIISDEDPTRSEQPYSATYVFETSTAYRIPKEQPLTQKKLEGGSSIRSLCFLGGDCSIKLDEDRILLASSMDQAPDNLFKNVRDTRRIAIDRNTGEFRQEDNNSYELAFGVPERTNMITLYNLVCRPTKAPRRSKVI